MSATAPDSSPLIAVTARQADDLNRGITYQVWRSVEAWVNLYDQQALFLEGVEDFDVVGKGAAVAAQVKATAAAVTLRSETVTDLLVNFWRACRDNPGKEIHYRLITTSPVGTEQDSPLPSSKGLELWRECATRGDLDKVRQLQDFLATDTKLTPKLTDNGEKPIPDPSLLKFLQTAMPAEVLDRLIRRITLQTESEDGDLVRESVAVTLRAHGEKLGVRPSECSAALDRLFRIAAETAGRKSDRRLTRDRFRVEFEEATTQRLTASEVDALRNAGPLPIVPNAPPGGATSFGISLGTELVVQRGVPELPTTTLERKKLVSDISAQTLQVGLAVIHGSSGMGKSTLAQLVARGLGDDWLWADFQGLPATAIPHVTRAISIAFAQPGSPKNLVLDNLNFEPADLAGVDNALAVAARAARNRGGKVLVTTQRELPLRVLTKLGVQPTDLFDVPRLGQADIEAFCLALGCPLPSLAKSWAQIVAIQTSGHPRLVHARLVGLKLSKWPAPQSPDVLATAPEIHEELDLARQLLDRVPAGDKELLYRLSIASGPFRRDHAVEVGKTTPPIPNAADAFSRLVGPWIDRLRSGYFRLSPLLHGAAEKNWPKDQVQQARSGLARAMLKGGDKTLIEANEILFQGLIAKDEEVVTAVAISLLQSGFEEIQQFAERFDWLPLLGRQGGPVFATTGALNFILRLLQFRIMSVTSPTRVGAICEIIDREMAETDSTWVKESRAMWLSTALIYFQAEISPRTLLRYWEEMRTLIASSAHLKKLTHALAKAGLDLPDSPTTDAAGHLLMMVLARRMDDTQLVEFADAVNELSDLARTAVLGYLPQLVFPLRLMVERVWTRETTNATPNWPRVLTNLASFRDRTRGWNLPQLSSYVARAQAAIEDEYRENPDVAIAILDEAALAPGSDTRLVEDQKAIVLYRQKKYRAALDIWQRLLPQWKLEAKTADHTFLYASQRAGHCAGVLGQWPQAIEIFRRASDKAQIADAPLLEAAFVADQALAEWKNDGKAQALVLLARALTKLERLKPGDAALEVHRTRKCVEQVVKWTRCDAGASDEPEWEPPAGMCSRVVEPDEKLKDYPACPFDILWFFLADAEQRLKLGTTIFDQAWKRKSASKHAAFRSFITHLKVRSAFARLDFATLLEDVDDLAQGVAESKAQLALGRPPFEPDAFGKLAREDSTPALEDAIRSALIALVAADKDPSSFLTNWRNGAKKLPNRQAAERLLDIVKQVLDAEDAALPRLFHDKERLVRSVAALRMSGESKLGLDAVVVGQTSISGFVTQSQFRPEMEFSWAEYMRSVWRKRIATPALIPTPALTIPPIRAACDDQSVGLKLAARILLEARHAGQVAIPADILEIWRATAERPSG